jgi:hypothetical protein
VRVSIQGHGDGGVTEELLDDLRMDAPARRKSSRAVARKGEPLPTADVSKNQSNAGPSGSEPKPGYTPTPEVEPRPQPEEQPEPKPGQRTLSAGESDWQRPTQQELEAANEPRHYNLPAGAIMGLTIDAIGIYNAPVFDSDSQWALVHRQYRFRTVSYGKSHETTYLRTFVVGKGARAARSRIALQRHFHFAPFPDAPGEFEGG